MKKSQALFKLRVVESEDELRQICDSIIAGADDKNCGRTVLMQSYEHKLRSFEPFQCWILMSVISTGAKK